MVRLLVKAAIALVAVLGGFAALALWSPVTASRIVWPVVERAMLAGPFHGVTAHGQVESGLFRIEATRVSTLGQHPHLDATGCGPAGDGRPPNRCSVRAHGRHVDLRAGHAEMRLAEVVRHWNDTYFTWVGGTGPDAVFYYRIHSPVVMIEYDHQTPVALAGPDQPSRNHVHTGWRPKRRRGRWLIDVS